MGTLVIIQEAHACEDDTVVVSNRGPTVDDIIQEDHQTLRITVMRP